MKYDPSSEIGRVRREKIRQLGFDPQQLTADEQREILDLEASLQLSTPLPAHDLVGR